MEHHRNASDLWHLDQCTKRCLANHALERKSPKSVSHKNGTQHTEWWEEFFRWKSLETQNIASILTCFVSWGFFWLEQTWNRGMYKQIQNCDQFASSKQYVVVMHYLKKNICMEKKSDRFHRRDKIGFLNSVKIGTEELWQQTKDIFLNENPIFLHTRFFSDPLLLHFL